MFQLYFSHFERSLWKIDLKQILEKFQMFPDEDLPIKSFDVEFRALMSAQIACMEIFLMLRLQFFELQRSFLENGMEEKFWKNSFFFFFSNQDLSSKWFNIKFIALVSVYISRVSELFWYSDCNCLRIERRFWRQTGMEEKFRKNFNRFYD